MGVGVIVGDWCGFSQLFSDGGVFVEVLRSAVCLVSDETTYCTSISKSLVRS